MSSKRKSKKQAEVEMSPEEMAEHRAKILRYIDEVRPTLLKAGLSTMQTAFKKTRIEEATPGMLKFTLDWFVGFKHGLVHGWEKSYKRVPESVWITYAATGTKGTFEQIELNEKFQLLKAGWKDRPRILKRDPMPKEKKGTSDGE